MEAIAENWFFVLILLGCIGIHFFGHGHGHGSGHGNHHRKDEGPRNSGHQPHQPIGPGGTEDKR